VGPQAWCQSRNPRAPSSARRQASSTRPVGPLRARRRWRPALQPTGAQPTHAAGLPRRRARAAPLVAPRADERGMCTSQSQWCTARCAAGRSARHCGRSTATPLTTLLNCERTGPFCGPCCGAARALRCASHRTLTGAAYAHRGGALRAAVRSAPLQGLTSCAPHVVRKSAGCLLRAHCVLASLRARATFPLDELCMAAARQATRSHLRCSARQPPVLAPGRVLALPGAALHVPAQAVAAAAVRTGGFQLR
jgi:hypothetical protein